MAKANNKLKGAQVLPADADVDFVLHTPGRDYDLVDIYDLDDDEIEELEADEAPDFDEEAVTGVWDVPTIPNQAISRQATDGTPWWQAARQGVRAQASYHEGARHERSWWEAARMGLRAPADDR